MSQTTQTMMQELNEKASECFREAKAICPFIQTEWRLIATDIDDERVDIDYWFSKKPTKHQIVEGVIFLLNNREDIVKIYVEGVYRGANNMEDIRYNGYEHLDIYAEVQAF